MNKHSPGKAFLHICLLAGIGLLAEHPVQAQGKTLPEPAPPAIAGDVPPENKKSFGDVILKLGGSLAKEVKRRLNLEETAIVRVKKEAQADGSYKLRVETDKFTFYVRKRNRSKK